MARAILIGYGQLSLYFLLFIVYFSLIICTVIV